MQIDLNDMIAEHLTRLESLANEASMDDSQSYASRASAMTALTNVFKELIKSQQELVNMERLMKVEKVVVETLREYLTDAQQQKFMESLEEMLEPIE